MIRNVVSVWALAGIGVATAVAQEDVEAERERGREVLEAIARVAPEELLGTIHFGSYTETKNTGVEVLSVERAPADSGATYAVRLTTEADVPDVVEETSRSLALLDERLGLVSYEADVARVITGMDPIVFREELRREGAAWLWRRESKEEVKTARLEMGRPEHGTLASLLLLGRALELADVPPGRFRLHMASFAFAPEVEPTVEDVVVEIAEPAPYDHRGREVGARRLSIEATLRWTLVVGSDGALLAYWVGPDRDTGASIAGTAEEAAADLAPAPEPTPDEAAALATALKWFELMAGELAFEDFRGHVDWEAARAEMATRRPEVAELNPEAFEAQFRKRTEAVRERMGDLAESFLATARLRAEARVEGDEAVVTVMGDEDRALKLRRAGSGWRLTRFP